MGSRPRPARDRDRPDPAKPYCYEYPRPALTVDVAVFGFDGETLRVLLIRRKAEPFAGAWALPGGFVDIDEEVPHAAARELREETGLERVEYLSELGVFGAVSRDPRGRVVSVAHTAVVRWPAVVRGGDDAAEAAWLDPDCVERYAFDHAEIVAAARQRLRRTGKAALLTLLPRTFTIEDAARLARALRISELSMLIRLRRMERRGVLRAGAQPGGFQAVE
jgi:8-oxo-dGTP diphosphatase